MPLAATATVPTLLSDAVPAANVLLGRITLRLAADADLLFIECVFLSSEADHAARKFHLTAAQAGRIARAARAKAVIPFHFSPRYLGREAELRAELERARAA